MARYTGPTTVLIAVLAKRYSLQPKLLSVNRILLVSMVQDFAVS